LHDPDILFKMNIIDGIRRAVEGHHLSRSEAESLMNEIMAGQATDAQIAAFLTALRMKCETVDELIGFAKVIRARALPVRPRRIVGTTAAGMDEAVLIDTCGTGGDAAGTFNISTAAAFVVAGAGVPVAKHGNKSASSPCGSADVMEALGVRLDLTPDAVAQCIDTVGIGLLFAPLLHKAMRFVAPVRREMKIRTVFNLLGPLCNPAGAKAQLLGVYDEDLTEIMAQVLCELGTERAFVVHGSDGLDEITITGESKISEVKNGEVRTYYVTPEDFGIDRAPMSAIQGGDASQNAEIIREVLTDRGGAKRDIVLLNAAAGLLIGGKAGSLRDGIRLAHESVQSGKAMACLQNLIALSQSLAPQ
jgi:anthranilate phosphoribosyltransferase